MGRPNTHLLELMVCLPAFVVLEDLGKQGLCLHVHHWGMKK